MKEKKISLFYDGKYYDFQLPDMEGMDFKDFMTIVGNRMRAVGGRIPEPRPEVKPKWIRNPDYNKR